ncbi:MAG TPA: hypothetical protein VHG90_07980, partial [Acidimicrobiales bacterium]|nr:hypothetical protein [Acidimicrobiales bacterium]
MKRIMAAALLTLAFNVPPAMATSPRTEGLPDELARVRQQLLLSEDLLTCAPVGTPAHGRAAAAYDRL